MLVRTVALGIAMLLIGGCNQSDSPSHEAAPAHQSDSATPAAATPPQTQPTAQQALYTCPMHPKVTSDKPGKCPLCGGMDLVLQETPAKGASTDGAAGHMHNH